ncbi:putative TATA box-binding protein-like protein 1 [Hypsibius exemplaris]|uniref:TATA box-binding protein-like protein 1 n=1 Tax=Hypsibius exemplaris TaxID=2072580 RepID=A0A9X6NEE7_HYPEX|nr:putative TATA box-binding protein-like protein 1 [Hypsibius exemplaris]
MAAVWSAQYSDVSSSSVMAVHPSSEASHRAGQSGSVRHADPFQATDHESRINGNNSNNNSGQPHVPVKTEQPADIKVEIVNVLCNFKTHCHLDLRTIAMQGANVEWRRDPSSVLMKLRSPPITSTIWSTGKVICMGARSEADALIGARRIARNLQKCGFKLRFVDFQVKNVLGVVSLPFGVRIDRLKDEYPREVSYEPELHPAASWRVPETGGQLQIFQTGSLSVTAPNVAAAQRTFDILHPRLRQFSKPKEAPSMAAASRARKAAPVPDKPSSSAKRQKGLKGDVKPVPSPVDSDDMDWDESVVLSAD